MVDSPNTLEIEEDFPSILVTYDRHMDLPSGATDSRVEAFPLKCNCDFIRAFPKSPGARGAEAEP